MTVSQSQKVLSGVPSEHQSNKILQVKRIVRRRDKERFAEKDSLYAPASSDRKDKYVSVGSSVVHGQHLRNASSGSPTAGFEQRGSKVLS